MVLIQGKHNTATAYTSAVEPSALEQITNLLDQPYITGSRVCIMPDVHAGKGCTIGTTMTLHGKVVPNLVGVDIGCGMLFTRLDGVTKIDLPGLDRYIHEKIPSGFYVHKQAVSAMTEEINALHCLRELKGDAAIFNRALGSLGGGNHFIEVSQSRQGEKYLIIHSGSRNLGKQVADYYQKRAISYHCGLDDTYEAQKSALVAEYKAAGRRKEIQNALKDLTASRKATPDMPEDLCYLEGRLFDEYIHDMRLIQAYASKNRQTMAGILLTFFGIKAGETHETVHNYIDVDSMILRKGAVSAKMNEILLIPMNMRDGSLLCKGKGNEDWNSSAPHGAGRLFSRSQARGLLSMEEFSQAMGGIFTTSVCRDTLDESPMAYKPMDEILENIKETVDVIDILKPLYNFKAAGD